MRLRLIGAVLATAIIAAPVPPATAHPAPDSFADLAQSLLPAVVNVSSSMAAKASADAPEMPVFPPGSPFEQFFKDFMNRHHGGNGGNGGGGDDNGDNGDDDPGQGPDMAPDQPSGHPHRMQSLGSGFIIDPEGYVVTNNHVIEGADEITVTLQDNTTLKATLVGHDDRTDLALLKVQSDKPLPAVKFGDSDAARVGDWVLAIGNPFGLGGSVTAGIVSARGRDIQQGPYDDFIQTDAAINKGNSGGPLFNMAGDVIGINTAILSPSGGSIGLGFAIPSGEARVVVDQLRQYHRARRGWLGVRIQQVTPDIAETLGLHGSDGALVAGVNTGGPADRAHLQNGDVILTFNGQKLHEMRTLPRVVAETPIDRLGAGGYLAQRQAADRAGGGRGNARQRKAGSGAGQPAQAAAKHHRRSRRARHEGGADFRRSAAAFQAGRKAEGRGDHRYHAGRHRLGSRAEARRCHCRGATAECGHTG